MVDFHLIIRASGERTAAAAQALARLQLPSDDYISVIQESPFEEALRATYREGIKVGKKWTMTLDADVLLRPGAIGDLIAEAEGLPADYAQVEGRVYDKFTGLCRPAGQRVYRTEYFSKGLEMIPEAGSQLRPETFVLQSLAKLGHQSRQVKIVMGVHDHFQSYHDLYCKSIVHSKKNLIYFWPQIIERCVKLKSSDLDFVVILRGVWDGLNYEGSLSLDREQFSDRAKNTLLELGISEKPAIVDPLEFVGSSPNSIDSILAEAQATDEFKNSEKVSSLALRVVRRFETRGAVLGVAACLGAVCKKVGQILEPD